MSLSYKALLFDLSGVLYEGDRLIPGAIEAVQQARTNGLVLRFVTNTATQTRQTILAKLQRMGIPVEASELITAPMAARQYLQQAGLRPYCLVHQAIKHEFDDLDQHNPNAVLLGDARDDLNYTNLNRAFQLCQAGHPLIAIGYNKYFKDENGLNLDAGAFVHALEWAADTQAIIMGKPGRDFFVEVVATTPFSANQCLMLGDDLMGDVVGALDAGLQACLVRTGKFRPGDEAALPSQARIIDSVAQLF